MRKSLVMPFIFLVSVLCMSSLCSKSPASLEEKSQLDSRADSRTIEVDEDTRTEAVEDSELSAPSDERLDEDDIRGGAPSTIEDMEEDEED